MIQKLALVLGALIVLAACAAPVTVAPTAAPTAAPAAVVIGTVGQPAKSGNSDNITFTVMAVQATKTIPLADAPKSGNVFIVCDLLIQNTGNSTLIYNSFDYTVKDADGYEYEHATFAPEPQLHSGKLAAGDKVRGNLAFEVPQAAKALVITYDLSFFNMTDIRVSLGDAPTVP